MFNIKKKASQKTAKEKEKEKKKSYQRNKIDRQSFQLLLCQSAQLSVYHEGDNFGSPCNKVHVSSCFFLIMCNWLI